MQKKFASLYDLSAVAILWATRWNNGSFVGDLQEQPDVLKFHAPINVHLKKKHFSTIYEIDGLTCVFGKVHIMPTFLAHFIYFFSPIS